MVVGLGGRAVHDLVGLTVLGLVWALWIAFGFVYTLWISMELRSEYNL